MAAVVLALGATAAVAQTTMPPQSSAPTAPSNVPRPPVAGQIVAQDPDTVLAKELIGLTVYAPDKAKIGAISDLILSKDGKTVDGFVIGVGGFLGIGEKSVAMKLDRLQIRHDPQTGGVQLTMDAKKEELANTPTFKSKRDQEAEKQAERARSQSPGQGMPNRP